jgi:hypothetical protein
MKTFFFCSENCKIELLEMYLDPIAKSIVVQMIFFFLEMCSVESRFDEQVQLQKSISQPQLFISALCMLLLVAGYFIYIQV